MKQVFRLFFFLSICLGVWTILPQGARNQTSPPQSAAEEHSHQEHSISGVFLRNKDRLLEHPDVFGVSFDREHIIIHTDRPEAIHFTEVEGIPVKVVPTNKLPPPPGVIVLHPGGGREHLPEAEVCPRGFWEQTAYRWRFCQPNGRQEPIPQLMHPPIAGIPYEECLKIIERHRDWALRLPGVMNFGLGAEGIIIETDQPELIPPNIEGLPVEIKPPVYNRFATSHTGTTKVDPLHGGAMIGDIAWPSLMTEATTLGGIVVSEGKLWGITVGHTAYQCKTTPIPCPLGTGPLNDCPHYSGPVINQPPPSFLGTANSDTRRIGNMPRRGDLSITFNVEDMGAIFLDNDTVEGNGSFTIDKKLEIYSDNNTFKGTMGIPPNPGDSILIVSGITSGGEHLLPGTVQTVGSSPGVFAGCQSTDPGDDFLIFPKNIFRFLTDPPPVSGGSGSLVLDVGGNIVGMQVFANADNSGNYTGIGGAYFAFDLRRELGFDMWYGPESVKDNTFGVYRTNSSGAGTWELDNGDGRWDGCVSGSTQTTEDKDLCLIAGTPADLPITGDWTNPDNDPTTETKQIGFIRPSTSFVYLDRNNNGWDPTEGCTTDHCGVWGDATANDLVVAGDWDGDGRDEIGRWNPPGSWWTLDNGNLVWDECGGFAAGADECAIFGVPSDRPVVGDWNNDGTDEIGVYRPNAGMGMWYLDANGNRTWDGCNPGPDLCLGPFGLEADSPIAGDWTGTGPDKIGVFQPFDPFGSPYNHFTLDNGDGVYDSPEQEQILGPFGLETDKPIVWNQSVVKAN